MKNSRVAIITPVFPPYCGGIGTVALQHARLLSERGCDVSVFTPDYGKGEYGSGGVFSVELLKPVFKYGNAAWVPQLQEKLKNFDSVVLQYPFFGGMRSVYKAKEKYGFKLILNYHMDVVGSGLKGAIFWYATKFFLPRIVKSADIVAASSQDYARHSDLGEYWRDNDKKFKVLPIGVNTYRFKPSLPDEELRKNLNIKPSEKIILFVGGLDKAHYFKGVDYLIRAIPLIRHAEPRHAELDSASASVSASVPASKKQTLKQVQGDEEKFKVVVVGRGELQNEYRELAQKLGVKDKVLFTGGISDKALVKLYQMSYVTVLPSIDASESFGIVLVESMACGTPVIASNLPGVRSVFDEGRSGITVNPRDYKPLANALLNFLVSSDKRDDMSNSCIELVAKKYSWSKIGEKLSEVIVP